MSGIVSRNAPPPLLSIRDLRASYRSRSFALFGAQETQPVLAHVDLDIAPGELFGLVGESGSGKTTLARCIVGLVPFEGEMYIDGENRNGGNRRGRARNLPLAKKAQMVFQDSGTSLNPAKKIGWLMEEPLVIHGSATAAERERKVDETLRRVGLDPSYKKRRVNELSGGQKQRVCIGRALMPEPKLLIADEAISSLDVSVGAQILNLFRELHETTGLSILFISHNTDAVAYLCDRIATLRNGRIVGVG